MRFRRVQSRTAVCSVAKTSARFRVRFGTNELFCVLHSPSANISHSISKLFVAIRSKKKKYSQIVIDDFQFFFCHTRLNYSNVSI